MVLGSYLFQRVPAVSELDQCQVKTRRVAKKSWIDNKARVILIETDNRNLLHILFSINLTFQNKSTICLLKYSYFILFHNHRKGKNPQKNQKTPANPGKFTVFTM